MQRRRPLMHNATGAGVQPDSQNGNYSSVVSDLVSLIEHMQASMKMLEGAIARELPLASQEVADNVIVLDDITPCYLKANAALRACKAGLGVALDSLSGGQSSSSRIIEFGGSGRRAAQQ